MKGSEDKNWQRESGEEEGEKTGAGEKKMRQSKIESSNTYRGQTEGQTGIWIVSSSQW